MRQEKVTTLVVGEPKQRDNTASSIEVEIAAFLLEVAAQFPSLTLVRQDERFTSKMARRALLEGGASKKIRQKKEVIDKISATLILQGYLEQHKSI
jgi:putative Holliday junction resolvase